MMHDHVVDERKGPIKTLSSFPADAWEQKLWLGRTGEGWGYFVTTLHTWSWGGNKTIQMWGIDTVCVPTCPMSPTTLPVPSILGLLHSAPAKSVRAAAAWASGSGSPRFIPRTAAGPPAAFARGPAAVSMSLSRSIIPRLTGSIIDATSVDINIGRQTVTSQKSVFYLCLLLLVSPQLDIHNGFSFSQRAQTDNFELIFINMQACLLSNLALAIRGRTLWPCQESEQSTLSTVSPRKSTTTPNSDLF